MTRVQLPASYALEDYAKRCLRDVADQEYIAARRCFRNDLFVPFFWIGHQAVEKYLKVAIALNGGIAKFGQDGHDIQKIAERLGKLTELNFRIPDKLSHFFERLSHANNLRYFIEAGFVMPPYLVWLDWTVWYVRRYSQKILGTPRQFNLVEEIEKENSEKRPISVILDDGFLELHLKKKRSSLTDDLVWQNPAFTRRRNRRKRLRNYPQKFWALNPTQVIDPSSIDELSRVFFFPKDVIKAFRQAAMAQE